VTEGAGHHPVRLNPTQASFGGDEMARNRTEIGKYEGNDRTTEQQPGGDAKVDRIQASTVLSKLPMRINTPTATQLPGTALIPEAVLTARFHAQAGPCIYAITRKQ